MILSGSTDPKVHAHDVAATKAMRAIPIAALPTLHVDRPRIVRESRDDSSHVADDQIVRVTDDSTHLDLS
jgi:hypothetical protein